MFRINDFIIWFKDLEEYFKKNKKFIRQYIQHVWTPGCLYINHAPDSLKQQFTKSIQNTAFEHLSKSFTNNNYDYQNTLNYFKNIDKTRGISILDYIPELVLHYQV